jgi:hypothetical protein
MTPTTPNRLVSDAARLIRTDQPGSHLAAAQNFAGVLGRPVEVLDREHDLEECVVVRLSRFVRNEPGEFLSVPRHRLLPVEQPLLAAVETEPLPPLSRAAGSLDRVTHVTLAVDGVLGQYVAGARVQGRERSW